MPIPGTEDPNRLRTMTVRQQAATTVINASLKANDNILRKTQSDTMRKLLDLVNAERGKSEEPATVIEALPSLDGVFST